MPRFFRPILSILALTMVSLSSDSAVAQQPAAADSSRPVVLVPAAVWDGIAEAPVRGWVVVIRGAQILAAGPSDRVKAPAGAERLELAGTTLIPGLIEGHSHLFLHPYDETLWDDQVLKEPAGIRMARAVAHAAATVGAGVTTVRDLGTEGMADYDVQLRRAVEQGIVPGPRILATTRAIVATGSYGPRRSQLRVRPAAGRRGGERRGADHAGGARTRSVAAPTGSRSTPIMGGDRTGRRSRRSPRRSSTCWWPPRGVPARRWPRTPRRRKGCGGRRSRASPRSSTATPERPRSSG